MSEWSKLEKDFEVFLEYKTIHNQDYAIAPYYDVPLGKIDQLSLAYLSYELYSGLSQDPSNTIGLHLLRHLYAKYDEGMILKTTYPSWVKALLIDLLAEKQINSYKDSLYDYYLVSLIYEIILWKCLPEYNRLSKFMKNRTLHDLIRDLLLCNLVF